MGTENIDFYIKKKYHICHDLIGQWIGGLIVGFAIPNVIYVGISKVFDHILSF
jgi:hypothetical protein